MSLFESEKKAILVILGPTGCGKTKLSVDLCKRFNGEAISTDSMQIYKGLDIATNKVTQSEAQDVPHHMISFLDPLTLGFTVVNFRNKALEIIADVHQRGKLPIIVGGTNYYIESILWKILVSDLDQNKTVSEGKHLSFDVIMKNMPKELLSWSNEQLHQELTQIDPLEANRILPSARRRIIRCLQYYYTNGKRISECLAKQREDKGGSEVGGPLRFKHSCIYWVQCEMDVLEKRLDDRIQKMLDDGLIKELIDFYDTYHDQYQHIMNNELDGFINDSWNKGVFQCIGLKEFKEFLQLDPKIRCQMDNPVTIKAYQRGLELLKISNKQYAKRQNKWVRNRCLTQDRDAPPVYKLDTTNESDWDNQVLIPACHVTENFLIGKTPTAVEQVERSVAKFRGELRLNRPCEACDKVMATYAWTFHEKSWSHRYNVRKRNDLLREVTNTLDYLVEKASMKR